VKFSEFRKKVNVKFSADGNRYSIAELKEVPKFSDEIFAVIKDKNEVTVIAKEGIALRPISEEKFFKLITFEVSLPFDLSGFLSHVSALLANKDIPIFAISAYSTDHVFVREADLDRAVGILKKDGMVAL
jgi:hypothetical protein